MFKPVKEKSTAVYEKIMAEIKSAILQGQLKPGDKLPGERILADLMGVSRTSLREALKLLEASGLVEIKHGQGVFIVKRDLDRSLANFLKRINVDRDRLKELFEIRKVLETQAAAWAALRASGEQVQKLGQLVEDTRDKLEDEDQDDLTLLARQDSKFHNTLAVITGNSVLVKIMEDLLELLVDVRVQALSVPGRPIRSLEEHRQVVQAIRTRKPAAAYQVMLQHLQNVEEDIL